MTRCNGYIDGNSLPDDYIQSTTTFNFHTTTIMKLNIESCLTVSFIKTNNSTHTGITYILLSVCIVIYVYTYLHYDFCCCFHYLLKQQYYFDVLLLDDLQLDTCTHTINVWIVSLT